MLVGCDGRTGVGDVGNTVVAAPVVIVARVREACSIPCICNLGHIGQVDHVFDDR